MGRLMPTRILIDENLEQFREIMRDLLHPQAVVEPPADLIDPPDPFGIDHDCSNPAGHYPVRMHGEIVCPHCSKVIWQ